MAGTLVPAIHTTLGPLPRLEERLIPDIPSAFRTVSTKRVKAGASPGRGAAWAPSPVWPERIVLPPRDDVDVKLRHDVADSADIELVAAGDVL